MASFLDINSLYQYQVQKEENKKEYYEQIVRKVHNRIQNFAVRNETMCVCEIPEFVFGIPLYNRMTCCKYIMDRLKSEGFKVHYIHPYNIYINWAKEVIEPYVVKDTNTAMGTTINRPPGGGTSVYGGGDDDKFINNILKMYGGKNPNPQQQQQKAAKKPTYQPNGRLFN